MSTQAECSETYHDWVPHGQLHISFEENAIRFPDGRIVMVKPRHLEALLAIPPNVSLSLEEIAGKINKQRETHQAFFAESPGSWSPSVENQYCLAPLLPLPPLHEFPGKRPEQ